MSILSILLSLESGCHREVISLQEEWIRLGAGRLILEDFWVKMETTMSIARAPRRPLGHCTLEAYKRSKIIVVTVSSIPFIDCLFLFPNRSYTKLSDRLGKVNLSINARMEWLSILVH
jgi:hypothetical protein